MMGQGLPIAVDVRMRQHPGIGRYIRELTHAMVEIQGADSFHFLDYPKLKSKIYSLAEQWELSFSVGPCQLLHTPHFNIPLFFTGKQVATVHDLTYLHDKKASKSRLGPAYAEFLIRNITQKAVAVLTVSEYTKNDLLTRFPKLRPEKVFVTYEAASGIFYSEAPASPSKKPYILFVGSLKEHKNIPTLIAAVESLRHQQKLEIDLVLVGKRDPKNEALWQQIHSQGEWVRYVGEVTDEELANLYRGAEVFVLPSFREGFGLPVVEAMACGTPVIVSDRTSLPEIAGDAALIFNANHVDELSSLLYNVLSDSQLRKKLSQKGLERATHFSWKKTAQQTLAVYQKVIESP